MGTDGSWERGFVRDPAADALDSLLYAVYAAWAYARDDENYGAFLRNTTRTKVGSSTPSYSPAKRFRRSLGTEGSSRRP